MKTGRRRKRQAPEEKKKPSAPPKSPVRPRPASQGPPRAASHPRPRSFPNIIPIVAIAVILCILLLVIVTFARSCFAPRVETYLPATAEGSWQTTVKVLSPQMTQSQGWRSDCEANPDCTVVLGTCEMRQREDAFTETQVDAYDDYVYTIYYEETEGKTYEASGAEFVVTELNRPRDWVEGNRHYHAEEWLDTETCEYTSYAVWIADPEDVTQEVEVVLSECEVWEHVIVKERTYEDDAYCQTEIAGTYSVRDAFTEQGTGASVVWFDATAPVDGRLEREFEGTVVFRAGDVTHTVRAEDEETYIRYLTVPHYLGLGKDGRVLRVTDKAP